MDRSFTVIIVESASWEDVLYLKPLQALREKQPVEFAEKPVLGGYALLKFIFKKLPEEVQVKYLCIKYRVSKHRLS